MTQTTITNNKHTNNTKKFDQHKNNTPNTNPNNKHPPQTPTRDLLTITIELKQIIQETITLLTTEPQP